MGTKMRTIVVGLASWERKREPPVPEEEAVDGSGEEPNEEAKRLEPAERTEPATGADRAAEMWGPRRGCADRREARRDDKSRGATLILGSAGLPLWCDT